MNDNHGSTGAVSRRTLLKAAGAAGVATLAHPRIIMAQGDQPVKLGGRQSAHRHLRHHRPQ